MKYFIFPITSIGICICIAHEHSPRQVAIGGMQLPKVYASLECNPIQQLQDQPIKSAIRNTQSKNELSVEPLDNPLKTLIADTVVACSCCTMGVCITCTIFPQLGIVYNCAANCMLSSCMFSYWLQDQDEDITSAQLTASKQLLKGLKSKAWSILNYSDEEEKDE